MDYLHVVSSGSHGNCYLLSVDGDVLIIDCGVPIKIIKSSLGWDISHVSGAICCHKHKDHSLSINELSKMGIKVFSPYMKNSITSKYVLGDYSVTGFPIRSKEGRWLHTNPDGTECPVFGFLIEKSGFVMVYMSDFMYCPYTFKRKKPNVMLIECNHCDGLLSSDEQKYSHSVLGHASLEVTKGIVEANRTDSLANVILCHLSEDWSDEKRMVEEVQNVAGNNASVCAASQNTTYILNTPHI